MKKLNNDEKIQYILDNVPETNDDLHPDNKLLILTYWYLFDDVGITPEQFDLMLANATPPETISRDKRRIRNKNKVDIVRQEVQEELQSRLQALQYREE